MSLQLSRNAVCALGDQEVAAEVKNNEPDSKQLRSRPPSFSRRVGHTASTDGLSARRSTSEGLSFPLVRHRSGSALNTTVRLEQFLRSPFTSQEQEGSDLIDRRTEL